MPDFVRVRNTYLMPDKWVKKKGKQVTNLLPRQWLVQTNLQGGYQSHNEHMRPIFFVKNDHWNNVYAFHISSSQLISWFIASLNFQKVNFITWSFAVCTDNSLPEVMKVIFEFISQMRVLYFNKNLADQMLRKISFKIRRFSGNLTNSMYGSFFLILA